MKRIMIMAMAALGLCAQAHELPNDSVLNRLAANMLMVGFKGNIVNDKSDAAHYIKDLHIGSIVLFDIDLTGPATIGSRNVTSVEQLDKLTKQLQAWSDQPLLIAVDQEGGKVARLKTQYGFQPTVSAQYLGTVNNEDTTRMYAARIADDMARVGLNINLAPVLDVRSDSCFITKSQRAISSDFNIITDNANWIVDEHQKRGVACALKHFPGHGSAIGDTHYGLVDVTETWSEDELLPYKALIDSGKAEVVMTAHIYNHHIDPDYPATLSHKTLQGLLRDKLGYDGVIITDDIYMEGIVSTFGIEEAIVLAINAGADLICAGNNGYNAKYYPERPFKMTEIIVNAVKEGRIPVERLIESNARIDKLRAKVHAK